MPALPYRITISEEDVAYLKSLIKTRTIQSQVVDRARILLWKSEAKTDKAIADGLGISVNTVRRCVDRYLNSGIDLAIFDDERSGRPVEITDDAKAWIVSTACQKPCDLGYAAELWTLSALHRHIQAHAEEAGYPRLKAVTKPWLQKYLKKMDIKPFRIKYYLERKDPDFEDKMHDVLLVYKQVEMQFGEDGTVTIPESGHQTHTISYDEKPGIQAIANKYPDHTPTKENGYVRRDYEYVRLGTLSLLAGIDLLTGNVIPLVSQTHKSCDFIEFLKILDAKYPESDTIRLILDNHSAHTSKETRRFLATLPEGRFEFVFTPTHTSWLNMIESFFSKMTKQMLKGIRVNSKDELSERIYRYFDEINADPIVYHWTYKMDEINSDEAATI
ncbi:MAG: IS630 family transposase [Lachnospiraceae bacterium]|jgi:transposase|nr:IS630 family transposase [Lachnospiraceae bacterium]